MEAKRSITDAFFILLGESPERIDRVNKLAEENRAHWLATGWDPTYVWEPPESDSEYDQTENLPITPPKSPKEAVAPKVNAVNHLENQQSRVVSNLAPIVLPTSTPRTKSRVPKRQYPPTVTTSRRMTRSKASTEQLFYELSLDGKTSQPLSGPESSPLRPRRSLRAVKPPYNRRSAYRIQKK